MAKKLSMTDDERADLVAYLDGELDVNTAHTLETKLNIDANARAEAESLRRTWELLDYLPQPEAPPTFSNQTLEKVSILMPARGSSRIRFRPWFLGIGWAAALFLAAWGGYAGMSHFRPRDRTDRELLNNFSVIEHKRLYDVVADMSFLRALDHPDLFGDDVD